MNSDESKPKGEQMKTEISEGTLTAHLLTREESSLHFEQGVLAKDFTSISVRIDAYS